VIVLMLTATIGIEWEARTVPTHMQWRTTGIQFASAATPVHTAETRPARLMFEPKPEPEPKAEPAPTYSEVHDDAERNGTGLMVATRMVASVPYWQERARMEGRTYCIDDAGLFAQGIHRLDAVRGKMWRRISHLYAGPNYWKIERFTGGDGSDLWTGRTKLPGTDEIYTNVVVMSPESFGCPACESLKGRLRSAGIAFHSVTNDNGGPWPRLYSDGVEVSPATVGALQAVAFKSKTKIKTKGQTTSAMVGHSYSSAMMGMQYSASSSTKMVERMGMRRGPIRSIGALLFNRRGVRSMRRGQSRKMRTRASYGGS